MFEHIRNVFCVGRNYGKHAAELGNAVPESPMIFSKPTHALVPMDDQVVELPGNRGEIHHEAEVVLLITQPYEPGIAVEQLIGQMALGIDFTLRDLQNTIKQQGYPWLPAKGFLGSAPIGDFFLFPSLEEAKNGVFSLAINGQEVQRGAMAEMIFDLQTIVDYIGANFGLGVGDVIYTGTPAGVGAVKDGDRLELFWEGMPKGSCRIGIN